MSVSPAAKRAAFAVGEPWADALALEGARMEQKRKLCREYDDLTDKTQTAEALASAHARKRDELKAKAARLLAEAEAEDALYDQFSDEASWHEDRQFEIDEHIKALNETKKEAA